MANGTPLAEILHCFGFPYRAGVLNLAQGVFNSLNFHVGISLATVTLLRFVSHMYKYITHFLKAASDVFELNRFCLRASITATSIGVLINYSESAVLPAS